MITPTKGEKTRAEIVECAKGLFYERGYDGTSFTDIVDATGLRRGNIYHYFKTKDEILRAVIERHLEAYGNVLHACEKHYTDPRDRLHAFLRIITQRKVEVAEFGCPIGSLNTELGKDRRDLQESARRLFELFRHWLAARFAELGHAEDADTSALHFLGRAQGIAVIAHAYEDAKLLQREVRLLDRWVDEL